MQNELPLLTVIIPCYKVERYLDRCMRSVVGQTYKNLEIILVDDGSPDNTGVLCDKWAKQDKRIKVIHKQNEGLGFARNSGLEIANGDFVAFVDSDDYIDSSMYERLICKSMEIHADIVYCGHLKQMSNGTYVGISDFKDEAVFDRNRLIELSQGFFKPTDMNPRMLTMSVWHAIYRRSIITQVFHSEREVGSEDIHFQVCAMLNSKRVVFIPDCLYVYCYNGESLSHTLNIEKFERYKKLNKILNDTYRLLNVNSPADYCVFIMAFSLIRRISLSGIGLTQKWKLISEVVKDSFWDSDKVDSSRLAGAKRIFYSVLKLRSVGLMYMMAHIYCLINYSSAKKGLE